MYSHIATSLESYPNYAETVFAHFSKIARVLTSIEVNQPVPTLTEKNNEDVIGYVDNSAVYIDLWTKLEDSHRMAQGSFDRDNIYYRIQSALWGGMATSIVPVNSETVYKYAQEILDYIKITFNDQPSNCVETLRVLFSKIFSGKQLSEQDKPKNDAVYTMAEQNVTDSVQFYFPLMNIGPTFIYTGDGSKMRLPIDTTEGATPSEMTEILK